ncbi:hypothetical protein LSH36_214g05031 [Paralvinella palmiformis]|uniref:Uncharacterized protein n=1 Tax=Paralvinella palmiformis TaxID=53620 RepID=A0AAD9JNP5_9ANNE|nr:hypothetical protein LSH36_214g05031 [Paralvinella palmiformis]
MLSKLPSLQTLGLGGNSLFCDCNILWLIDEVKHRPRNLTIPNRDNLVCESPTILRGITLNEVDETNVPDTCAPRILPLYSLQYAIDLGDSLRLNCRAVGRPVPQTDWLLPGKRSDGDGTDIMVLKTGKREGAGVRRLADHISISLAGTLTVDYAAATDGGQYTCLASNPRGRDERTAHVRVKTNLADVIILGVTQHSVTVTWRSRSFQHTYRILYRRSGTNDTYHSVNIEPYMRTFTANDLTPKAKYEFCIAMEQASRTVRINCTLVTTRRQEYRISGLFNARNFIIGGAAGCFALVLIVVCTATYFIKRYNRRKRAQEELYSDNLSQLFLASMDSMSDTTPITYENTGAEMFDDDDIDEIRSTASMPGCSTYTSVIRSNNNGDQMKYSGFFIPTDVAKLGRKVLRLRLLAKGGRAVGGVNIRHRTPEMSKNPRLKWAATSSDDNELMFAIRTTRNRESSERTEGSPRRLDLGSTGSGRRIGVLTKGQLLDQDQRIALVEDQGDI